MEAARAEVEALQTKLQKTIDEHAVADKARKEAEDQQFFMLVNQVNAQKSEIDRVAKERDDCKAEADDLTKKVLDAQSKTADADEVAKHRE